MPPPPDIHQTTGLMGGVEIHVSKEWIRSHPILGNRTNPWRRAFVRVGCVSLLANLVLLSSFGLAPALIAQQEYRISIALLAFAAQAILRIEGNAWLLSRMRQDGVLRDLALAGWSPTPLVGGIFPEAPLASMWIPTSMAFLAGLSRDSFALLPFLVLLLVAALWMIGWHVPRSVSASFAVRLAAPSCWIDRHMFEVSIIAMMAGICWFVLGTPSGGIGLVAIGCLALLFRPRSRMDKVPESQVLAWADTLILGETWESPQP